MSRVLRLCWIVLALWLPAQVQAAPATHSGQYGLPVITLAELPAEARDTLRAIRQGGPFAYSRDGVVFGNFERVLPMRTRGCTSDTLLTKSADCGRKCEAGAPAQKGSAPPCRVRYHEYTVNTPGASNRGARRIISGEVNEYYYTADHYQTFRRIRE
jgi:ribonuclease T1